MELKIFLCLAVMLFTVIALFIPDKIINTVSYNRNLAAVLIILASSAFLVNMNMTGFVLTLILAFGCCIHWLSCFVANTGKSKEFNHDRH